MSAERSTRRLGFHEWMTRDFLLFAGKGVV